MSFISEKTTVIYKEMVKLKTVISKYFIGGVNL